MVIGNDGDGNTFLEYIPISHWVYSLTEYMVV